MVNAMPVTRSIVAGDVRPMASSRSERWTRFAHLCQLLTICAWQPDALKGTALTG